MNAKVYRVYAGMEGNGLIHRIVVWPVDIWEWDQDQSDAVVAHVRGMGFPARTAEPVIMELTWSIRRSIPPAGGLASSLRLPETMPPAFATG